MEKQKKDPLPGNNESLDGPDGIRTHDLCGKSFLTQCECVIQTRLDDRSNIAIKRGVFLSLGSTRYVTITLAFYTLLDNSNMLSLEEFDAVIDKMNLAFEYVVNLGQYVEAAKILYQINAQLPDYLQLAFEELDSPDDAKSFIVQYRDELKSAITYYRQRLMII